MSLLIDSTILLEQLENDREGAKFSQQQIYLRNTQKLAEANRSLEDITKIFIRGCERIVANLNSIREIHEEIIKLNKARRPENADKIALLKRDKASKYDNSSQLLRNFINHFSVCNDPNALDFAKLMFDRFNFIMEQLDCFFASGNMVHLKKAEDFANRAVNTLVNFKVALSESN